MPPALAPAAVGHARRPGPWLWSWWWSAWNFYLSASHPLPLARREGWRPAFALNMSYGYFVESRSKRELAPPCSAPTSRWSWWTRW